MHRAWVRFYAELNDYLAPERRGRPTECRFHVGPSVKDLIESLGVPHTEVDLVLLNGESVGFDRRIGDGDRVSVFPVFEAIDITPLLKVRPAPLRVVRFALDVHLGRLAAYLRMLGFDAVYRNDWNDRELAAISRSERRILLTRDRGLLKRNVVTHGRYIRETSPRQQLQEVVERFDLYGAAKPLTRCLACNVPLAEASPSEAGALLPPEIAARFSRFWRCSSCGRLYWEGSHYRRMRDLIDRVLAHGRR
ncbi:MAG: Mut7-C ubiquitin/RNAse domain-containing protein [Bryobacteraceae bacterium]|nr:Mut7-C ubiquitin/RNAse domain-containing protein [Bryobacteraceae bacterium]